MIIQCSVENFLSIKDTVTINTSTLGLKEKDANIIDFNQKNYVLSIGLFGPNASGKTNFIKALGFVREFLLNSNNLQIGTKIRVTPFKFDENTRNKPSKFDVIFVVNNIKYQYGFSCTTDEVVEEYLYYYPKGMPKKIFIRTKENYKFDPEDKKILDDIKLKNTVNKLFLATATNWNYKKTEPAYRFLTENMNFVIDYIDFQRKTFDLIEKGDKKFKSFLINFLKNADFNISDVDVKSKELSTEEIFKMGILSSSAVSNNLSTVSGIIYNTNVYHDVSNKKYSIEYETESLGTINAFSLSSILYYTFLNGGVLLIDEIDKSMHPLLVKYIIEMFHNEEINISKSQLIFTTHDTNFLDLELFRREQIWFVEKDYNTASTKLIPLTDYSPRKNDNAEKNYLLGRYGAIPYINESGDIWEE